jgi:hypothetical protein
MPTGREEILGEILREDPRLLRVDRVPLAGIGPGDRSSRVALSFDVGCLTIERVEGEAPLRVAFGGEAPEADDSVRADEEPPWWTVLGQPMVHAWALSSEEGERVELVVQFRHDGENPKLISFRAAESGLVVTAQAKADLGH